jgi:hypothetical protein
MIAGDTVNQLGTAEKRLCPYLLIDRAQQKSSCAPTRFYPLWHIDRQVLRRQGLDLDLE